MKHRNIKMISLFLSIPLMLAPISAQAQYTPYDPYSPQGGAVEVNLDVLNETAPTANQFNPNHYDRLELKRPMTPANPPVPYQSNRVVLTPPPSQPFVDMKDNIKSIPAPVLKRTATGDVAPAPKMLLKPSGPRPPMNAPMDNALSQHVKPQPAPTIAKPTINTPSVQPTKMSMPVPHSTSTRPKNASLAQNPRTASLPVEVPAIMEDPTPIKNKKPDFMPQTSVKTTTKVLAKPIDRMELPVEEMPETIISKKPEPVAKIVATDTAISTNPTEAETDFNSVLSKPAPIATAREIEPAEVTPPSEESFDTAIAEMEQDMAAVDTTPELTTPPVEIARAVPTLSDLTVGFDGNTSDLSEAGKQRLEKVITQLNELTETRLQVRAFATGEGGNKTSARRISLSRALTVRSYLMDNGIKPTRVDVRAMGTETDRSPLDRVDLLFAR